MNGHDLGGILIGAMLVLAAFGAIAFLVRRYFERNQPGFADPRELFDELCQAHQLTAQETFLLNRLAQSQRLDNPALLFVEPEHFEAEQPAPDLAALREKLFAAPAEPAAAMV